MMDHEMCVVLLVPLKPPKAMPMILRVTKRQHLITQPHLAREIIQTHKKQTNIQWKPLRRLVIPGSIHSKPTPHPP
jgi:hypothetical protein